MTRLLLVTSLLLLYILHSQASYEPPLYKITASSLYDAGRQHGVLARARIQSWVNSDEFNEITVFIQDGKGREAYERMRNASSAEFPQYADELRGIAEGAQVPLGLIWAGQLMIELENLMLDNSSTSAVTADHCTDVYAISSDGYKGGFSLGHNEDWSPSVGALYYYVKYTAAPGADFVSCAGLAYPGALIGWAPTWNAHGMFMTVNTLVPKQIDPSGITTSFIQRDAICGLGKGHNLSSVVAGLSSRYWADGASVNLVDTRGGNMASVEVYTGEQSVLSVTESMGNYSHFNLYRRLAVEQWPSESSMERKALLDSFPPPQTSSDITEALSQSPTVLRNTTIATLLIDGTSGRIDAWGGSASASTLPIHSWNLFTFFDE